MENETELHKAIMSIVEKSTFTPEALEKMQALIKQTEKLGNELKAAKDIIIISNNNKYQLEATTKTHLTEIENLKLTIKSWEDRENALVLREKNVHNYQLDAAVQLNVAMTYDKIINLMFKNTIMKESIIQNSPVLMTSSYNNGSGVNSAQVLQPSTSITTRENTKE